MFRLKIYRNDNGNKYYEDGVETYDTLEKAMCACYENAIYEANENMACSVNSPYWYEVNTYFEITPSYVNELLDEGTVIPVAVIRYDHDPWDRENDCEITIISGYTVYVDSDTELSIRIEWSQT